MFKIGSDGKFIIPESSVQNSLIDYYVRQGYEVIRFNSGGGKVGNGGKGDRWLWFYTWFGRIGGSVHKGVTDAYVFGKGIYFWIEFKRKGGDKRTKQTEFVKAHKASGLNAEFIDSYEDGVRYEQELQAKYRASLTI